MRLDHLLSREIRVLTRGGVGALMAPKVDRTVDRSPLSGGWRRRRKASETESDPTKNTDNPFEHSNRNFLPLFKC